MFEGLWLIGQGGLLGQVPSDWILAFYYVQAGQIAMPGISFSHTNEQEFQAPIKIRPKSTQLTMGFLPTQFSKKGKISFPYLHVKF
jgi:hypothetical protein